MTALLMEGLRLARFMWRVLIVVLCCGGSKIVLANAQSSHSVKFALPIVVTLFIHVENQGIPL